MTSELRQPDLSLILRSSCAGQPQVANLKLEKGIQSLATGQRAQCLHILSLQEQTLACQGASYTSELALLGISNWMNRDGPGWAHGW